MKLRVTTQVRVTLVPTPGFFGKLGFRRAKVEWWSEADQRWELAGHVDSITPGSGRVDTLTVIRPVELQLDRNWQQVPEVKAEQGLAAGGLLGPDWQERLRQRVRQATSHTPRHPAPETRAAA